MTCAMAITAVKASGICEFECSVSVSVSLSGMFSHGQKKNRDLKSWTHVHNTQTTLSSRYKKQLLLSWYIEYWFWVKISET